MISVIVSVLIDGVRTKRSIYKSVVDEVLSIGEASARDDNEMRRKALLCEIQLLNQFGATSWRDRKVDRRSLPPLLRAAKCCRILVRYDDAGRTIGKAGSSNVAIEAGSSAHIKLSGRGQLLPGTEYLNLHTTLLQQFCLHFQQQ